MQAEDALERVSQIVTSAQNGALRGPSYER